MDPYAQRYGGHQFGNWANQLGDGRAITLGEVDTRVEFSNCNSKDRELHHTQDSLMESSLAFIDS